MVVIKKCECKSTFQDKEYGYGNRVYNTLKKGVTNLQGRCTVCSKVQII